MNKKRVLLGLDPLNLPMAVSFFGNRDKFSVTIVTDGEEALRSITEKKPHLAILNVNLPKKGGDKCCQEVRLGRLSPGTVIVLTVWMQKHGDIRRCLDAGCDALLPHPLVYDRLSDVVSRLLFKEKKIPLRFDVLLPVRYGITSRDMTEKVAVDLSPGGLFLEAQHVEPVGTPLKVSFTLPPDAVTISCNARVAWLNRPEQRSGPMFPAGMGLEFIDIAPADVSEIRRFLLSERRLQ